MSKIMMARLLVSSQRNGMSAKEGNIESKTLGIVSPTTTQNATMPPKALYVVNTLAATSRRVNIQEPLRERYRYQPRFAKTVLYRGLERVGAAELGVYDDESYGPVYHDGKADEEGGACHEAGVANSVWLADDTSSSVLCQLPSMYSCCPAYIILFAMFMNALRIPLRGRACSRWSSGLKDSSATVTLGASIPVSNGSRCVLSRPSPPSK